jgi:NAD(P)-dependent dehydrogenase (short-subunit alcohol dehydrogenase family)
VNEESVVAAYATVAEAGKLDVVVANAGVQLFGNLKKN